jgi:hypothetical protein
LDAHVPVRLRPASILLPWTALLGRERKMDAELTAKVIAWATETARRAVDLPSRQARDDFLAERRRELVAGAVAEGASQDDATMLADACVSAARRIMTELLAQRAGVPHGRA